MSSDIYGPENGRTPKESSRQGRGLDQQRVSLSTVRELALFDGDNTFAAVRAILGSRPSRSELPGFKPTRRWLRERPDQAGASFVSPAWLLDGTNATKIVGIEEALKHAGWRVFRLNRDEGPHPACRSIRESIDRWADHWDGPLLVGSSCRLAWDQVFDARRRRPSERISMVGYTDLVPADVLARAQDLGIEVFDFERDVGAHAVPLTRTASTLAPFNPAQLLELQD